MEFELRIQKLRTLTSWFFGAVIIMSFLGAGLDILIK